MKIKVLVLDGYSWNNLTVCKQIAVVKLNYEDYIVKNIVVWHTSKPRYTLQLLDEYMGE